MIFKVDWMKKHTPITFDYDKNTLSLKKKGLMIELLRLKKEGALKMITTSQL